MNLVIRYLGAILSLLFIFSCHKSSNDNPAPGSANTANFITRVIQNRASSSGKGMYLIDFVYDNQKRVDKIVFTQGDSVNGAIITTPLDSCKYYYNGTEKNPYKSTGKSPYPLPSPAEIYYYFDNTGLLIRDSIKATISSQNITREYNYSADKIIVKKTNNAVSVDKVRYDSFIVKNHDLVEAYFNLAPQATTVYGYKCIYDNKINPVSKLNIAAQRTVDGINIFADYLAPGFCQNNLIEFSYGSSTGPGNFTATQNTKQPFTYSEAGLIDELKLIGTQDTVTLKYYYEK